MDSTNIPLLLPIHEKKNRINNHLNRFAAIKYIFLSLNIPYLKTKYRIFSEAFDYRTNKEQICTRMSEICLQNVEKPKHIVRYLVD